MDTGVTKIVDDKYATAPSGWIQVSRKWTTKSVLHIGLYIYIYIYISVYVFIYIYICVCVCVCVCVSWISVSLELLLSFSRLLIFKIILYIKFPWHHFHETNIHITFQPNWKAAMCVLAKETPCTALCYSIFCILF